MSFLKVAKPIRYPCSTSLRPSTGPKSPPPVALSLDTLAMDSPPSLGREPSIGTSRRIRHESFLSSFDVAAASEPSVVRDCRDQQRADREHEGTQGRRVSPRG